MRVTVKPAEIRKGDVLIETGQAVREIGHTNSLGTAIKFTTGLNLLLSRDTGYEVERPVAPSAVAVDTHHAYVFSSAENRVPFTVETATAFAARRNECLKVPTYKVYALTLVEG